MHTPETANSLNEPAISMAVRAYDAANALNNRELAERQISLLLFLYR